VSVITVGSVRHEDSFGGACDGVNLTRHQDSVPSSGAADRDWLAAQPFKFWAGVKMTKRHEIVVSSGDRDRVVNALSAAFSLDPASPRR